MPRLNELVGRGDKKFGSGTYRKGSTCQIDFPRIPTGIFPVDFMLAGGFPVGVTSSIYGPPGGGKTLTMTRLAVGVQNLCFRCFNYVWECSCSLQSLMQDVVIVQTEMFDIGWAMDLGLDADRAVIAEASSGEQASDIIVECLQADDCGLVLLDSLPMLTPTVELEASAMDVQVAAQAKLISKLIRRIKSTLIKEKKRGHRVSFITTNQIRAKIGGFGFGPKEETPGGFMSKHDWHLTLRMSQLKSESIDKETELPIDARFKASTVAMGNKRKLLTLAGSCEFYVQVSKKGSYLKGTINDFKPLFRYADEAGLITRNPWVFAGKEYKTQKELLGDWLDPESVLSAKRFVVDHYVQRQKDSGVPVEETG